MVSCSAAVSIPRPRESRRTLRRGERAGRLIFIGRAAKGLAGRRLVQADGSSNEGRESLFIDLIVLVEVDGAPGVAFEA